MSLETLKNAYEHNAASMGGVSSEEQYVTTLCDGKTEYPAFSNIADKWDKYTYMDAYSTDGKIVYQYTVHNDLDVTGVSKINFAVYAHAPQSYILGEVGNVGSFKIVPEFRNNVILSIETVYFPKAYDTWAKSWEVVYSDYFKGATCTGYTCINKTGQTAKSRLVYRYYWKTDKYADGVYDDLQFSGILK